MDPTRVRNLGIVAHIDAGKTTVSEHVLFDAGVQHKHGSIDDGDTTLDWMAEERERGITITAAATTVPWPDRDGNPHQLNLIDTPGHVDFTVEVERAMRVLDGAVLVVDAVQAVQAQTETVWRQMERYRVPALAFVNKLDRVGADYLRCVARLRDRLGAPARPVQYPILGEGEGGHATLDGIVCLLSGRVWTFADGGKTASLDASPVPDSIADEVGVLRSELIDELAGDDEGLLELVGDGVEPPVDLLRAALRQRVIARTLVPVYCGSGLRNFGVQPLLDAVVDLLPSPLDMPPVRGRDPNSGAIVERACDPEAPTAALCFKLQADAHGERAFVRVYSGRIEAGTGLWNPRTGRHERINRILRVHANGGQALEVAEAGDIVALIGPKQTGTGDTLCPKDHPIALESLEVPDAVLTRRVEPKSTKDRDKLKTALLRMSHEDPSLHVTVDDESPWLVAGMGELHLEVAQHRLETEHHVACNFGEPRVEYREAVRGAGRGSSEVSRAASGATVFGAVEVEVVADAAVDGAVVDWDDQGAIPTPFRMAVESALRGEATSGPRCGFPLTHARIRVVGGRSEPAHDSEAGFTEAAVRALRAALENGQVDFLEPWMALEVQIRDEFANGVIGDLNSRGAVVEDVQADGELRTIHAHCALTHLIGYATRVRSLSQGSAQWSLTPADFRAVPEHELGARGLVLG